MNDFELGQLRSVEAVIKNILQKDERDSIATAERVLVAAVESGTISTHDGNRVSSASNLSLRWEV